MQRWPQNQESGKNFRVLRILFIALVICVLAQSVVPGVDQPPEQCLASCPDDSPAGDCSPLCADCTCCGHALRTPIASATVPHPPGSASQPARASERLARLPGDSASDVFHVPISLLA